VFIGYQRDVTGAQLEDLVERSGSGNSGEVEGPEIPREPTRFTRELVEGVEARRDELDDLLEEQAVDWHVERIAPLERAILRVALYEMLYRSDVPDEVAIDEAVEISKLYCGSQAPGFVNGILGGIQRKVRHA
jgi:N utilization substance protein B